MHILLISLLGIIILQGSFQLLQFNKSKAKTTRSRSKRIHNIYKRLLNIEKGRVRENSVTRLPGGDLKKRQTATWSSAPPSTSRWRTRTSRQRTSRARRSRSGSRWRQWRLLPIPPSLQTHDIQIKWTVGVKRRKTRFDLNFLLTMEMKSFMKGDFATGKYKHHQEKFFVSTSNGANVSRDQQNNSGKHGGIWKYQS